jgi:ATP-dependent RNA helicase DDX54/DBP10
MAGQFSDMSLNPDIIVATPGRLLHHIIEVGISFKRLEVLVFDEADRMFEMGFSDQIAAISKTLRVERQTMLFSATLPTMVKDARLFCNFFQIFVCLGLRVCARRFE